MSPDMTLVVDNTADTPMRAVATRALTFPEQAREIAITDDATYNQAADFLKGIKALRAEIAATFDPHIKRAHEAHKALVKQKADAEAPLTEAESIVKRGLVAYTSEQERKAAEERRRLQDIARREEEERRLARALELEQAAKATGNAQLRQQADAVLSQPAAPLPVVAPTPAAPKVQGISYRETYRAEVVDLMALVQAVAAGQQPLSFLQANTTAINGVVRSLKASAQIPGVQVTVEKIAAAGR